MIWLVFMTSVMCVMLALTCILLSRELVRCQRENIELEERASKYYMRMLGMVSEKDK